MALNFSIFLCSPEPLLQYPFLRAQKFYTTKFPDNSLQRGQAKIFCRFSSFNFQRKWLQKLLVCGNGAGSDCSARIAGSHARSGFCKNWLSKSRVGLFGWLFLPDPNPRTKGTENGDQKIEKKSSDCKSRLRNPQNCNNWLREVDFRNILKILHTAPSKVFALQLWGRGAQQIRNRKGYHKEIVWQRLCYTFGWTFWCDLPHIFESKSLLLLGNALELFRAASGLVRAILWLCEPFEPLNQRSPPKNLRINNH